MAKRDISMIQALVMTIAVQISTEVAIRDVNDYTIAFRFKTEEGMSAFIEAILPYEGSLSFSKLGLDVLVAFAEE
jgi:hypothetical protein